MVQKSWEAYTCIKKRTFFWWHIETFVVKIFKNIVLIYTSVKSQKLTALNKFHNFKVYNGPNVSKMLILKKGTGLDWLPYLPIATDTRWLDTKIVYFEYCYRIVISNKFLLTNKLKNFIGWLFWYLLHLQIAKVYVDMKNIFAMII